LPWSCCETKSPTVTYRTHRDRWYTCSGEVDRGGPRQLLGFGPPSVCPDLSIEEFPRDEGLAQSFSEIRPIWGPALCLNHRRLACQYGARRYMLFTGAAYGILLVGVYPFVNMSNIAPLVSGSMVESGSPRTELRMADIKFLVTFALSAPHNALASCSRQISRISGNLFLSHQCTWGKR
jgi:hypothetical protein